MTGEPGPPTSPFPAGYRGAHTCLRCHAEIGKPYNILSGDGSSFSPGGDFFWLKAVPKIYPEVGANFYCSAGMKSLI